MKKITVLFLSVIMIFAMCTCAEAVTGPVDVVNVPEKAAVIDGVISQGEWDNSTPLTLNISDTTKWDDTVNPPFIESIMPPPEHTDEDFTNRIRLCCGGGYLYYCEERIDSTPYYLADDIHHPYCQDSSLVWFVLPTGEIHSISVFPKNNQSGPFVVLNVNDDQENGTLLKCEIESCINPNGHIIEAKIPLSALGITGQMLLTNQVKITYATVNIFNYEFDGNKDTLAVGWGVYGYEAWYKGVTNWDYSPVISLTATIMYGDVDRNQIVNAADALLILQNSANKITFTDEQKQYGDVNLDLKVDTADALLALQYSVRRTSHLPLI